MTTTTTSSRRCRTRLGLLLPLALVTAACGSSSGADGAASTSSASTSSAAATTSAPATRTTGPSLTALAAVCSRSCPALEDATSTCGVDLVTCSVPLARLADQLDEVNTALRPLRGRSEDLGALQSTVLDALSAYDDYRTLSCLYVDVGDPGVSGRVEVAACVTAVDRFERATADAGRRLAAVTAAG